MPVLYLVEQGSTLRKDGDTLEVVKEGKTILTVPAAKVDQVVIFGNIGLTTPVIHHLLIQGIDCAFCSSTGRYHGRLFSGESKFGLLRQTQHQALASPALRLNIARAVLRGKLANQRTLMMRYARETPAAPLSEAVGGLTRAVENLEKAENTGSLLGIEGYASVLYYNAFKTLLKQDLGFQARVRRPPRDPVNSLLSFSYTLLAYDVQAAVRIVGLDPFLGFLHSVEYSKPSLALDIMEEFRPVIADSIVLKTVSSNILTGTDFQKKEENGMVLLSPEAVKKFIHQYEERLLTNIAHPLTGHQVTYRRCLELQVRQLARVLTGSEGEYKPFLVR
ncbi:MAG: CRISPR-associated endonuclease Cas1 [Chloroflexi bacterium]|nr:CRISPR-associated endonuclease Cas1 [Chloroflexota bacterium]